MFGDNRSHGASTCSAIFFILLFTGVAAGIYFWFGGRHVPKRTVLEVDFEQGMIEFVPEESSARFLLSNRLRVRDIVEALEKASGDDRVKGLVARVGQAKMSLAQVQEVRNAVVSFRRAGKPALAYAETFGEGGPGNVSYYLATAFDAIYLQPTGDVGLTGFMYEQPFFRGTLDKVGIIPRLDGRKEYKSYRYQFTERKYLPPHREEVMHLMESQFGQMVRGIAESRKLSEGKVRSLIDNGPFIGRDAVDAGLVEGLEYRDQVYDRMKEKAGGKAEFLPLMEYRQRAGGLNDSGATVALIYGTGGILRGKSGYNPATGGIIMGSDTLAAAFRQAAEDKDVKAILFRIDSPGGSVVASDTIWRETVNAKKAGKPIVVTMGSAAASGGYFIAMAADKIVAQPATVTGSIGVFGGKVITTGFWNKLGVTWDEVHTSRNADAWSMIRDFTPEQRARFEQWLDRIYEDFISKVGQGRNLSKEAVEKIAKGRIWTGEDAKRLGLVDELGGFPEAISLVRKEVKLPEDAPIRLKVYPEATLLSRLAERFGLSAGGTETESVLASMVEDMQPIFKALENHGFSSRSDILRAPGPDNTY